MTKRREKKLLGFTLLEVMLAVSIASVALIAVINSFSLIVRAKTATSNYTKALFLLEEKIFDLREYGFQEDNREGNFEAPNQRFFWDLSSEVISSVGLRKVEVTIFWQEANRKKELRVLTYLKEDI